jgi:hypothetical protein
MAKKQWLGGSFAPPLTDDKLSQYAALVAELPEKTRLREALEGLLNCCRQWWELPESTSPGRPHPVGVGLIVDLDDSIAATLWEHIPWDDELAAIQAQLDGIDPANAPLRDAAFHLLWHVKELASDREPLTADKL